jgi:hypothetical protein
MLGCALQTNAGDHADAAKKLGFNFVADRRLVCIALFAEMNSSHLRQFASKQHQRNSQNITESMNPQKWIIVRKQEGRSKGDAEQKYPSNCRMK